MISAVIAFLALSRDVFVSGTEGYDTFRIPALTVASNGDLLAFAEGRTSVADQASNKIVMKRLPRDSNEWSALQVVADGSGSSLNNPCVLTLPRGRVLLMFQRYPKGVRESTAPPGLDGPDILRSFVMESEDNGKTWGAPMDITKQAKRDASILTLASGPGIGIRVAQGKHRGRLLFPFNERTDRGWDVFALYSDDSGKTWRPGKPAPQPDGQHGNEVQMAEIGPDRILLNARNQGTIHARLQAVSTDGGETWSEAKPIDELVDPICMGSLLASSGKLYFSNPADSRERRNGTVYESSDEGKNWTQIYHFFEASFEYSSLASIGKGRLGCLYETQADLPKGRTGYIIRFAQILAP